MIRSKILIADLQTSPTHIPNAVMIRTYLALFLTFFIDHAHALTPLCQKAEGTIEINECMQSEQEKVEQKLNAKYKKTIFALSAQEYSVSKKAVIESQRAWVKFREKDCDAEATMTNGTGTANWYMDCMIDHAKRRIKRLKTFDPR